MTNSNDSHSRGDTSSGKQNNRPFSPVGLKSEDLYALEDACQLLKLGKTRYLEIRRKYVGRGIVRDGNAFLCYGRDLMKILIPDTAPDE